MSIIEEFEKTKEIRGIIFPAYMDEHKLIISGPPGSGKSTILEKIRGWGEEGYIDITYKNWWKLPMLSYRPRELHFGLPVVNQEKAMAIYEVEDFGDGLEIDFERISLPPRKKGLFGLDWSKRMIFEFLVPPAAQLFEYRKARSEKGTHHVDANLTLEKVQHEVAAYRELALFFHRQGLLVYLRDDFGGNPKHFTEVVTFKNPTMFKAVLNAGQKKDTRSHKWQS